MDFIRINNRKNFLLSEVPKLHPQSLKYVKYWQTQKRRCIEGFWAPDDTSIQLDVDNASEEEIKALQSSKWRWMPGNLYFYVNFCVIEFLIKRSKTRTKKRPTLRDLEWEYFYNWMEARGFSGFKDDEKYSCCTDILEYLKDRSSIQLPESCFNSLGEVKQYIPARQYIRQLFHKPMGLALFENQAKGLFLLGSRGIGKSYCAADGVILHGILFDEAREYNEETRKNPAEIHISVGAADSLKSSEMLDKLEAAFRNLPGEYGLGTDEYMPSPFYKQMAGTLAPNNGKNPWRHEYPKKVGGEWKDGFGSHSKVVHVIYKDDGDKAAGGRYNISVKEEAGLIGNAHKVHGSDKATMQIGDNRFGSDLWMGTGGNVERIQESEIIFRDPEGFDMLAFDDIWENSGKIGWFIPAYYSVDSYRDENGNTDVETAREYFLKRRETARKSKDKSALDNEIMYYPIVPSEMFLNAVGSYFPISDLKAQKAEIKSKDHIYKNAHYYGELVWLNNGSLEWHQTDDKELVTEWPIKNNKDKPGVIEIYEMPKRDKEGRVERNRYIQGTDTYDDDESSTNSLGSTFIMDSWTGRIVAEYTGRPQRAKDFYEITRKLNIFYCASHNYEQNKKGLFTYYEQTGSVHWLADTPESLRDIQDITISKVGNKAKGTMTNKGIIAHGIRLILDWLLEPAYGEDDTNILNLHKIRSVGLLDELMNYNDKGNFDRVSALIMLMIIREDKYKLVKKRERKEIKRLADDDFFTRNYDPTKARFKL